MKLFFSTCFLLFLGFRQTCLAQKIDITVDEIYNKTVFVTAGFSEFKFMNDGVHYTEIDSRKNILKRDIVSGRIMDTIITADKFKTPDGKKIPINTYRISANENIILAFTHVKFIYSRSYTCIPYTYNLSTRKLLCLSEDPVMNLTISPDGNKVAYVRGEDIFYRDLRTGEETRVTHDGKKYSIGNGKSDWVYEETFGLLLPLQWDPSGDHIAFYRFDESQVPFYTFPYYGTDTEKKDNFFYKYYRPGDSISEVTIQVYDLNSDKTVKMDAGTPVNQYIPRISWTADKNTLCLYKMPRAQNKVDLLFCDINTGRSRVVYSESDERYVDKSLFSNNHFLRDGRRMILMSEKSGWRHLFLYDLDQKKLTPITGGQYDVDELIKIDERRETLYFTAAYHSPMDRQLFSIRFDGKDQVQLSEGAGWHSVSMDRTSSYYFDNYSDVNTPPAYSIYNYKGKLVREVKNNDRLKTAMKQYNLSTPAFIKVRNRKGVELNAWILKPSDLDTAKKYPVLFMNYGGPGSQKVTNRWGTVSFWQQMLASRGYIIVCIDNTGTGFRGEAFKKETYMNLGLKEIQDQMDAVRWLTSHYNYVDAKRFGYWGWSFGGFMSSLAITLGSDYFKAAIAVAPVTDWRLYQAGYAERHMNLLQNNAAGYERVSPITYADRLKGSFLLIHGTGDDNVHFRNSVLFSKALMTAGKQFEQAYYPDKDHSIKGGNTSFHLYTRMTNFIIKNL